MPSERIRTIGPRPRSVRPTTDAACSGSSAADQAIPPDPVDALRAALDAVGVANEIVVYPGASHSFFDRMTAADASADAWRRMLGFVGAAA